MGNVLHFSRHKIIAGYCQRCFGVVEVDLPTACPGVRMTHQQMCEVLDGTIDYIHGYGWVDSRTRIPDRKTSSQLYQIRLRSSSYTDVA